MSTITILHFNDVYNVEPQTREPIGGAARFAAALKSFNHHKPLILFSGDIFAPSMMSTFTKGEQMVHVLNACNVDCAVFGNHDFDFGVDILYDFTTKTTFPWLISNVIDIETNRPLAEGLITHVIVHNSKRIGFVGLVEEEWLATLATLDRDEVIYEDYVTCGRRLATALKTEEKCDYVIALTHMRTPNDLRLASEVDEIDLILGGHDHVFEVTEIGNKYLIKSGTDFREFSKITLNFEPSGVKVTVEEIKVTSEFPEDETLAKQLAQYNDIVKGKMEEILGHFGVELDGRFQSIRRKETNLGNFICDIMLASTHSDLAILNSGTLRSDRIHPKGEFKLRDLVTVLPMMDPLIVINAKGSIIKDALENGVSQYPKLEGRFPQVSGVSFKFNPEKPAGHRIEVEDILIGDEPLDLDQDYRLVTKSYMHQGRDGYTALKNCPILLSEDESPELCMAIQNHFYSIKVFTNAVEHHTNHRQSLVCLSRRHSMVKLHNEISNYKHHQSNDQNKSPPLIDDTMEQIEQAQCQLSPKVDGRIINIAEETPSINK